MVRTGAWRATARRQAVGSERGHRLGVWVWREDVGRVGGAWVAQMDALHVEFGANGVNNGGIEGMQGGRGRLHDYRGMLESAGG